MQHHAFIRNTLLDELQSILHEYPDNEQIIKELLQNAEDAGARVVKMGFCPYSRSDHLPDPYRQYLSGPALCFYNDSVFEEKDWEGITMVRKSNKQDDPLKVGKFGIGFKSVFHITDTVCVISGTKILFIDPLSELRDPNKVCSIAPIANYVHPNVCGPRGLEPLYNLFDINKETSRNGKFKGTFFWFPLRKSPSQLSENTYSPEKVEDLFKSFKEEMSSELLFLTSIEKIGIYKIENDRCESECTIALDQSCAEKTRNERQIYKAKIRDIEVNMAQDDRRISQCNPVWMKNMVTYRIKMNKLEILQVWFIVHYFHAGRMNKELFNLIRNRRSKYRPYIGIAARLDEPIQCSQLFCLLPLPFEDESPTGLPVHVNGFFALDSNRQHLKWPSHDQKISHSHLENDMLWNVLMVQEVLPVVYLEFLTSWKDDSFASELTRKYLKMFYHHIPRMTMIKNHWTCVGEKMHQHLLESEIPCLESGKWIQTKEAYFAVFAENTQEDERKTVKKLFQKCTNKVIVLKGHEELFHHWSGSDTNFVLKCTNPKETRDLLRRDQTYKQLSANSKGHLLVYICSDRKLADLNEIELLPLQNGRYGTLQLRRRGPQNTVYLCKEDELQILTGKESVLILNTNATSEVGKVLESLASTGYYSFQKLNVNAFLNFLTEVTQQQMEKIRDPVFLMDSSAVFGEYWLRKVWLYLKHKCPTSLDPVKELNIIKTKESGVLKKLSDAFISEADTNGSHIEILKKFKIWIVDMNFHDHPLLAPGKGIVVENTDDGKAKILQRCIQYGVSPFNTFCSDADREWFKEFLPVTLPKSLIPALENLRLFKCFSGVEKSSQIGYTSVKECHDVFVGDEDFPIQFPKSMIMTSTKKEERLLSELSYEKVDLTICVQTCIEKITTGSLPLSEENKRRFCFYVLEKQSILRNWWKIQTDLSSVRFIKNGTRKLHSANELYDPNDQLLPELFLSENKFPDEDGKKMDLLRHLKFQSRNSSAYKSDIVQTCQLFDSTIHEHSIKEKKSKALLQAFRQNQKLFKSVYNTIHGFKILPFKQDRDRNYPLSMAWYSNSEKFVSLEMIFCSKFEYIAGSVLPTCIQEWEELIDTDKAPQLNHVMQHFCLAMECYNEDEHAGYSYLMREVYQHLAKRNLRDFASSIPQKCVLTELGFRKATDIYIQRNKTDVDLAPYYILLPKEYSPLKEFFERLGCSKKQSCYLLVEALKKIDGRQLEAEDSSDVSEDMEKVKKILKKLSEYAEDELAEIREEILVPIHSKDTSALMFRPSHECAYSDSDWFSKTFTEEDNICLIHSKIDKEIAKKLGVKSLKKFTLSDAEEIFSEFGQSEPLTQRLNRLLEEGYTDGLSVPKELIQNADDAGASEVYFLYDERENKDARSCLIDPGMEGCQGPALWAFNNAVFSPSDFQNIQKLSGATKKEDTTKIGKFGLGFNAVYNLTDVPSFASGKHLVYLDPHGKYLGEAIIHEKSPGIKLNLLNTTMLRKLENQFKPFQNVFGFKSSEFSEKKGYNGTIFRFPLRTKHQALDSGISSKEYSRHEMDKLLKMFCKSSGNMLLFTQNVKKIKLFHVGERSTNPDKDMELVLAVEKEENFGNSVTLNNENILCAASRQCSRLDKSEHFSSVCKTKITIASWGHSWVENLTSKEETNWIISWALGRKQSLKLFREKRSDGALPLSSVAIPGDVLNKQFSPRFLCARSSAFKRYGFYETGHLFCFLPLPIKTSLAFHVNGTFAISSDRQRILVRTEDDKENTKQTVWNNCLISDATLEALLELLIVLKNTVTEENTFYELWPKKGEDCFWETFQQEFYRCIVERELPIFKTHLGYRKFQDCIFLHIDVKADNRLHQIALDILKKTHLEGRVITEIPDDVYSELENCLGTLFLEHVVTYERFITESFLPSISLFNGEEYDHIVLGALRSRNNVILSALQKSECITTSPSGTKKSPGSLVHPRSLVSRIFITEDERFPAELFCKEDDLEILVRIGMMKDYVPFELLHSQTKAIANMSEYCTQCALLRSKEIVSYIHRTFQTFSKENLDKISCLAFLPVGKKPINWPVKWHSEIDKKRNEVMKCKTHKEVFCSIELFEKPYNLYFPSMQKLVGCSQAVIGRYDLYQYYESELQSLGVKNEKDVDLETLKLQLAEITKVREGAQNKEVEDICFEIYRIFSKRISEPGVEEFIQMHFPYLPCVITEKTFAYPKQVIFSLMYDCSPHFFGLRPKYASRFSSLMEIFGVRESFEAEDIMHVLFTMKEQYGETQMPAEELALVCRMAMLFENCHYIPTENLYLPDSKGFLCHVNDLCIDDFDWITTTDSMRFLNAAIPLSVAQLTGIKSKRDQSILNDSEEFGDEFGQHEELTTRIRRILDGYPEACILKELLQNADDAGASELHFIKDFRSHGTKHIFSDNWKELQGPALCVYNDSVFTKTDLQGIQNLGIGSKADDPTATGQYGVGFNVVYHLTDVPSFITRDFKAGLDTLCILDPHLKYIPNASPTKPGRKFQDATKKVGTKFTDIMSGYLDNSGIWKSLRGTLFRFPLRCNDESLLSRRITTREGLETLLDELKKEMAECLLFLNNVREISISSVEKDGSLRQEFIVKAEVSIESYERVRLNQFVQEVRHQMKKNATYVCSMGRKEIMYHLKVDVDNQYTQEWLIVSGFGFKDEKRIPDRVRKAYEERHLALLPSSGVAFNLMNKRLIQNEDGTKTVFTPLDLFKAYCFLPLPLITGLPVHINGHFALDHEARRNIWWPDDASSDLKLAWNTCLIDNVIVPTYISTIQYLKTALFPNIDTRKPWRQLDKFHKAFPWKAKLKDKVWEYMAKILYNQIAETGCPVFPIVRRDYQMLKMVDGKDNVNEMQRDKEQEVKRTDKPILQEELLEIRWVSILSGSFPAYFDEIKYQLKDDFVKQNYDGYYGQSYTELMRWASKQSEFLAGILKDLGMKLIESPIWMYMSMKNAGVNVHTVSPEAVLKFLKSYGSSDVDKCNVCKVNVHVTDTRFGSIDGVYFLLDYCLKDKNLDSAEFEHVPLLLTADEQIREFTTRENMYLLSLPELLPASANKIVHFSQFDLFTDFKVFESFVSHLQIKDFANLIYDNIPQRYLSGLVQPWNQQEFDIPNMKWIKQFWCFLSENLGCLEHEQRLTRIKTETKGSNVDSPVNILSSSIRKHLAECCFLPVLVNDEHKLYPFKDGKHVLKIISNVSGPEQTALTSLNVPLVDEECLPSVEDGYFSEYHTFEILKCLVTTVESVTDVLDCLLFNKRHLHLDNDSSQCMLDFFAKRLKILKKAEKCQTKLRSLPFYCGLNNNFITLPKGTIIVLPEDVPVDGLVKFGLQKDILFIRKNDVSLTLLEYLGCIVTSKAILYIHYILPYFQTLPSTTVMIHLKYIKDIVLPEMNYYQDEDSEKNLKVLKQLLQNIAFLPTESNRLARACEFFNPHKDIFKIENQLCRSSELPPAPFNEQEWEDFLVLCGMKSNITPEIFLDFANRLQRLGKSELLPVVMTNSRLMMNILFHENPELLNDFDLVSKVQEIKFLTPHSVQQIYMTIAPEFENGNKLVCFRNSTTPTNALLVWSVMGIVSEDLINMMRKTDIITATNTLGLLEHPPIHVVLDHTRVVCSVLKDQLEERIARNNDIEEAVTTMMSKIYGYLQKNTNEESKDKLKSIPFIFIKDRKLLVLPEQVVLDISEYEEIPPYLCKAPLYFGQYHTMFEVHGAAKSLTCSHLAKVLDKIWIKSKGNILEPNERYSAEKAVQLLFSKLKLEEVVDLKVLTLYLPSKKGNLQRSDSLVFVDHKFLEQRIGENMPDLDFFIGFKELKIEAHDPVLEISRLPEKYRPHLLSKIVIEQLDTDCEDWVIPSDYGKQLQKFLHCPEFVLGVCRLVRDEYYNNDKNFGEKDNLEILEKLQSVVVVCVERLTTVMAYKNKALPNTAMQRDVFSAQSLDEKDCEKLYIYFGVAKDSEIKTWINRISKHLSTILNTYLGKPLKENNIHLPDVLKCIGDPSAIEIELDQQEIRKIDVGIMTNTLLFMPELGSEIPISLHHLLDNSCTYIESGTFVAYELFDPIIDEDDTCDADPVYILAKVLQLISDHTKSCPNADEWNILYIIDIGSENAIEAVASSIYKFFRNDDNDRSVDVVDGAVVFRWKTDQIKSYIRDVLRNAFRRTHRDFKRAIKRLLLQYHPDMHQENQDYFNELTVFIFFIKKRLEEGKSVDDVDIFENFNNISHSPASEFEKTCNRRAANYVRRKKEYKSGGLGGGGRSSFFRDFIVKGPQPGQAMRWFRQAEFDFLATSTDKNQPNAYNWACYKSHQSAEKALKALLYQRDADQVDRVHNLAALVQGLNDFELSGLARQLEGITGNYFRMRYPDAVPGGHGKATPSDIYTPNQAEEAVEIAGKILELVRRKIPYL
ncbi:sacsin-like [Saccostrea echinata]|uniref:sacsin-like n=1 Tax=Saccostrea echinata TaxID=191078 RepID=UPI002A7F4D34|nr:sacsin-like [Saccostrea echinata]